MIPLGGGSKIIVFQSLILLAQGVGIIDRHLGRCRRLQQTPAAATNGPPAVQQAGRAMLGPPDAARDQSRLSRWHTRSSVLAHKSGSGPLAQSGTDESEGEAFRGLVDRHLPTVLAIARRMLRDDAEAEDVAQETMLRL